LVEQLHRWRCDRAQDFNSLLLDPASSLAMGWTKLPLKLYAKRSFKVILDVGGREYQDVGPEEYALIAAVAGRSLDDQTGVLASLPSVMTTRTFIPLLEPPCLRQFERTMQLSPVFLTRGDPWGTSLLLQMPS
jgi:ATP-dependent DNA helicase RecQ